MLLSTGSVWEIVVKYQIGRLALPVPPSQYLPAHLERNAISLLPINVRHVLRLEALPLHHKDPFDRLLIAQSLEENAPILTADPLFAQYEAKIVW